MMLARDRINNFLKVYMLIIGAAAIFSLILLPGLGIKSQDNIFFYTLDILIISSFLMNSVIRLLIAPNKRKHIKEHPVEYAIVFIFVTSMIIFKLLFNDIQYQIVLNKLHISSITKVYIFLMQAYILVSLLGEMGRANTKYFNLPLPPAALFVISFIMVILVGTLLLMLPGSRIHYKEGDQLRTSKVIEQEDWFPDQFTNAKYDYKTNDPVLRDKPITFIDALFTATSATCVTGLIVVPTGSYYSRFGQIVILILIQLGGLGLMMFATFFALILRQEFSMRHRVLLGDILDYDVFSRIKFIVSGIIITTLIIEAAGAVLIYLATKNQIESSPIFFSIFHSVSAFCNAGFSTIDANLEPLRQNNYISFIIGGLIIIGGLGFVVIFDILRFITRFPREWRLKKPRFRLQTKVVVVTSLFLIIFGAIVIYMLSGPILGETTEYRIIAAIFHSISTRTAGFDTVAIGTMTPATIFFMLILMFIGASPGSTGGGVKTTTVASLYALIRARLTGKDDIPLFNRSLSIDLVKDAGLIMILALLLIFMGTTVLMITEPDLPFLHLLFEEVSAFGTVGLSCGITGSLSTVGKIVIIITMFFGRIGPLTFLFAVSGRRVRKRIRNLEEKIMIG